MPLNSVMAITYKAKGRRKKMGPDEDVPDWTIASALNTELPYNPLILVVAIFWGHSSLAHRSQKAGASQVCVGR